MRKILLMADAAEGATKSKTIFVKATEPLHEDGQHRAKGEIFEIESDRAKALGKYVEKVNAKLVDGKLTEV